MRVPTSQDLSAVARKRAEARGLVWSLLHEDARAVFIDEVQDWIERLTPTFRRLMKKEKLR